MDLAAPIIPWALYSLVPYKDFCRLLWTQRRKRAELCCTCTLWLHPYSQNSTYVELLEPTCSRGPAGQTDMTGADPGQPCDPYHRPVCQCQQGPRVEEGMWSDRAPRSTRVWVSYWWLEIDVLGTTVLCLLNDLSLQDQLLNNNAV